MRHGSLFSGYEGIGLGLRQLFPDLETAWVADIDAAACKVLAHRFPHAPNLGDVSAIEWTPSLAVEILTAGFPCQDVSSAGKRSGLREGTRTGLWHETARAIAELRPPLVLLENVRGLLSARGDDPTEDHEQAERAALAAKQLTDWINRRHALAVRQGRTDDARHLAARRLRTMGCRGRALDRARRHERRLVRAVGTVLGSLADLGYDAVWCGLRAADVGFAHGRFRIFILAWLRVATDAERGGREGRARDAGRRPFGRAATQGSGDPAGHPASLGRLGREAQRAWPLDVAAGDSARGLLPTPRTSDTNGAGHHGEGGVDLRTAVRELLPTPTTTQRGTDANLDNREGSRANLHNEVARLLPTPKVQMHTRTSDAAREKHGSGDSMGDVVAAASWGKYAAAIARQEHATGRTAPEPTETGPKGNPRLSCRFDEWLMGLPDGWVTDVPDVSHNDALKLCGNGVVPAQCAAAVAWLLAVREAVTGADA